MIWFDNGRSVVYHTCFKSDIFATWLTGLRVWMGLPSSAVIIAFCSVAHAVLSTSVGDCSRGHHHKTRQCVLFQCCGISLQRCEVFIYCKHNVILLYIWVQRPKTSKSWYGIISKGETNNKSTHKSSWLVLRYASKSMSDYLERENGMHIQKDRTRCDDTLSEWLDIEGKSTGYKYRQRCWRIRLRVSKLMLHHFRLWRTCLSRTWR